MAASAPKENAAWSRDADVNLVMDAADGLGISERALSKLVGSAREKLGARTTHEALCRAMALYALLFL